jgi:hypothetical protein
MVTVPRKKPKLGNRYGNVSVSPGSKWRSEKIERGRYLHHAKK